LSEIRKLEIKNSKSHRVFFLSEGYIIKGIFIICIWVWVRLAWGRYQMEDLSKSGFMNEKGIDLSHNGQSDLFNERGCLIPIPSSFTGLKKCL